MMSIEVLPNHVIDKIAAGEVVERPSSVVKELLENALDAGAKSITVEVKGGGQRLIRMSDDGHGIRMDEVPLAFARHATSKLRQVEDLETIQTLGFRGEALASIASVSRINMITRHIDEASGLQIRIEGGDLISKKPIGAASGTVLTVENLFYNTPARLKFLKAEETEKRLIANAVMRAAMASPHVRFTLIQDDREVFRSPGSGQLADVLVKAFGLDTFRQMIEVSAQEELREIEGQISIQGFVSDPGLSRKDRSRITLFINGRPIQDSGLTYAVTQAYHTLLMKGRHPLAVLMVDLPPAFVDVNVHPTKAEVRFQDSNAVFVAVQKTVREGIVQHIQARPMRGGAAYIERTPQQPMPTWTSNSRSNGRPTPVRPAQQDFDWEMESPGQYPQQMSSETSEAPSVIPRDETDFSHIPDVGRPAKPRTLPMLRVVGQIGASYIVAEGPAGLYLIDQHAAHERVMYEQFMEEYRKKGVVSQRTLDSQTIDLAPDDVHLLNENQAALARLGFDIEPFGPNTFLIRAVPAMLANQDPIEAVSGILEDLADQRAPGQETIEAKIVKQVCKRASVKAGQILSQADMQGIIRQLERCESPHTCPHGRPTLLHISGDQLAKEFGRLGAN
jgi:DNA mismatch repair protein MutL